jgi:hypothetical protein
MIRILTADEAARTTIIVDGMLSDESVEPVQTCCVEALSKGRPLRLHLREVSMIDDSGRAMLRLLAAKGVDLTADGIFSSYIVDEIQSANLRKERCSQ